MFCSINALGFAPSKIMLILLDGLFPSRRAIFCARIGFGCAGIASWALAGAIKSVKDRRASELLASPRGTSLKLNYDGCKTPIPGRMFLLIFKKTQNSTSLGS
jgi:hypothetical protein